jgi:hypothetical protein
MIIVIFVIITKLDFEVFSSVEAACESLALPAASNPYSIQSPTSE